MLLLEISSFLSRQSAASASRGSDRVLLTATRALELLDRGWDVRQIGFAKRAFLLLDTTDNRNFFAAIRALNWLRSRTRSKTHGKNPPFLIATAPRALLTGIEQ
jgi:hypothetical protein